MNLLKKICVEKGWPYFEATSFRPNIFCSFRVFTEFKAGHDFANESKNIGKNDFAP